MAFSKHDPARPVRVRVFSPLGFYPKHSIAIPGARLLVRDDLIVSAVQVEPPEAHGFGDEHFSDLEFLALEETRFLAGITLGVHPDNGMAYTYPLSGHVDVAFGLDEGALLKAAQQHAARISERGWWGPGTVLPPACGGPAYRWREVGINVARVLDVVRATQLNDHLLMRGLGALLRADMCWQHREIAEAAVIQLYVALDVSFQIVLEVLRGQGVPNPSALDAGALIDEVFNPGISTGSYFEDYYAGRVKTMHPSSRFGVFAVAPLEADDYYHLRHALVEVYHWLITERKIEPE
ncbi:hypothetical protein [Burkholderia multivorans]|uniref:hypothetical protein n=1 Tax=Burkholderia multivorans TaxID=87883 RepID=UPI0020185CD9|nr:hypothetical protein [Burkholderia multivorans]MCO1381794.1 hypothetical protein [Burkholderia multivorans]MCO1401934.1 hypothetical protein [Burkholderia multivorans]UQO76359.1 hypothetical protein L0Z12_11095 [Burkholderia multivorans]